MLQILVPHYRVVMGNTLSFVKEIFEAADVSMQACEESLLNILICLDG